MIITNVHVHHLRIPNLMHMLCYTPPSFVGWCLRVQGRTKEEVRVSIIQHTLDITVPSVDRFLPSSCDVTIRHNFPTPESSPPHMQVQFPWRGCFPQKFLFFY